MVFEIYCYNHRGNINLDMVGKENVHKSDFIILNP